jgi:predicted N-acyltransferase
MPNQVRIINPIDSPRWDEQMLATGRASFFHSAAWAATLAATYGFTPCYFVLSSAADKIRAMVPLMEVRSFITGSRGVSLPFSDYCEPIWDSAEDAAYLLTRILNYGKKKGWKYLELRPGARMTADRPASDTFLNHTLSLSPSADELLTSFRESTRRNIKKAAASEVDCTVSRSPHALKQFYALNCLTRKRHGIPPQPFSFFKNIHDHIISQNKGIVILAAHQNRVIAGAVYFHFGKRVMYKYGASNSDYQHLRANYLVMWQAIRFYRQKGYETLDMGRTDPKNSGLDQFKNGWNPTTKELVYYKYSLQNLLPPREGKNYPVMVERIMQHLPVQVLRMIGAFAYRHVA